MIKKHASYGRTRISVVLNSTAGKGKTPDGNSRQSSLVFLDTQAGKPKFDIPFRADLIEREQDKLSMSL